MSLLGRAIEFFALYLVLPLVFYLQWLPKRFILLSLAVVTLYMLWVLFRDKAFDKAQLWQLRYDGMVKIMLLRLGVSAVALIGFTWAYYPELLFALPRTRPQLWMLILLLYPLISVYPQELAARLFFFYRYADFFQSLPPATIIILNAALFAWLHILFANVIAVALSFIAGLFFAHTYYKTRSLMLVAIEHAVYGNLLFTVGLGWFFYHGR